MNNLRTTTTTAKATVWTLTPCKHTHPRSDPGTPTPEQARLAGVAYVVLDEFHYMNEPSRGTVWEECCILCPPSARIIALSATMSNAPQIAQWLSAIHAPTELVAQP